MKINIATDTLLQLNEFWTQLGIIEDKILKIWIVIVFIVCGIINIIVSFFNDEYWFPILSLGIISVCFGIFGYLSQPKKDSN